MLIICIICRDSIHRKILVVYENALYKKHNSSDCRRPEAKSRRTKKQRLINHANWFAQSANGSARKPLINRWYSFLIFQSIFLHLPTALYFTFVCFLGSFFFFTLELPCEMTAKKTSRTSRIYIYVYARIYGNSFAIWCFL